MSLTLVVSLFLPDTISFEDNVWDDESSSEGTPAEPQPNASPPTEISKKRSSVLLELPRCKSSVDIAERATASPGDTNAKAEESCSHEGGTSIKRQAASYSDLKALAHSDAPEAAWGTGQLNQPHSRTFPLPRGSVLEFVTLRPDGTKQKAARRFKSPPASRATTNTCCKDGGDYETWTVEPAIQGNNGLTNAMRALEATGTHQIFHIGTVGFPTDALTEDTRAAIHDKLLNEHQSEVVYINDKDINGHYAGFCKIMLWPLLHYQIPDNPMNKAYADHSWEFYENVNRAFTDKVIETYKKGDTIWIHDYHLFLVPGMVRQKLPDAPIGFFMHTPFPSSEVFRCLAKRTTLLEGILGANLVAFQTKEYAQHFLQSCNRLLTLETTEEGVQLEHRFVNVICEPIGIDPKAIQEARHTKEVAEWIEMIRNEFGDKKLIVARDKLDYVYGVRQKLMSYELFLQKYPEWTERTVLIQVALSTTELTETLTLVYDVCGRIESLNTKLTHTPLLFLKQDIDFPQYLALLSMADCLVITSLRDGMNLTVHEFLTCQDGAIDAKKYGPVVLSEFAGSAGVLQGHLTINPYNLHETADAMQQALIMDEVEKKERWHRMFNGVKQRTGGDWAAQLSNTLDRVYEEQSKRASAAVPRLAVPPLCDKYMAATRRLIFLDYEGTIAPHKTTTGISHEQPQRTVSILNELLLDPKNIVYIMSGRAPDELGLAFSAVNGVGLIAENGCFLRPHDSTTTTWQALVKLPRIEAWKLAVMPTLKYFSERMEGSHIEERRCSYRLRYEKATDMEVSTRYAGVCAEQINASGETLGVQAVPVPHTILVESSDCNKSTAAKRVYKTIFGKAKGKKETPDTKQETDSPPIDFLMIVGDDREDEPVFRWANELGKQGTIKEVVTICVGKRNTDAQSAVTQGSTGFLAVLQKLVQASGEQNGAVGV